MKDLRCVFFDLDHTLWDYDTNSKETLLELFERHRLHTRGIPDAGLFHSRFMEINDELWGQYDTGKIESEVIRTQRFHRIFLSFGLDDHPLSMELSEGYINECPRKKHLMPFAGEILDYLHSRYPLTLVTNGFDETQHAKINAGGIAKYFKHIITSQRAGARKPEKEIFEFALNLNYSHAEETLMVGDNLVTDIGGARNASMRAVFFNPGKIRHAEKVDYEIESLKELRTIL